MLILSSTQDEPRIFVESEDQPDRMLLETKISKDDGYQKQQGLVHWCNARCYADGLLTVDSETLIVWTEQNGTDMALSFQEAEGCAVIWSVPAAYRCLLSASHSASGC